MLGYIVRPEGRGNSLPHAWGGKEIGHVRPEQGQRNSGKEAEQLPALCPPAGGRELEGGASGPGGQRRPPGTRSGGVGSDSGARGRDGQSG